MELRWPRGYGRSEDARVRSWVVWLASGRQRAAVVVAGREVGMMYWDFGTDVGWKVKDYFWKGDDGVVLRSRLYDVLGVHAMTRVGSLW